MLSLFWYYELIKAGFYKGGLFIQENYKTFMGLSYFATAPWKRIILRSGISLRLKRLAL